ncbi:MAG: hypothetical protein CL609_17230 [Anaerolineaceae bacterium]|nr:hypothetical protein [Anaerolineaceae bacterium]
MDTITLIQQCQAGDTTAIEVLVETYQSSMYRLAILLLDDPAEADEAVQNAFISACRSIHSYQGNASLRTWLTSIVINECYNILRKRARMERLKERILIFVRLFAPTKHPENKVIEREENDLVWHTIQTLGEKHRVPIILRYYQDLSVIEIAQILNIKEGTVHSRLNTARERLRKALSHLKAEDYE